MTRRERLERKLQKRLDWADSRDRKAQERFDTANSVPLPPFGEPIKIGHHSEKRHRKALQRVEDCMFKGFEHEDKAKEHRSKAEGIQDQLDGSIFSDDEDAIEALEARIAEREAERERMKAANKAFKKGGIDAVQEILDAKEYAYIKNCLDRGIIGRPYPSYSLSNIGANIRRDQARIKDIKRRAAKQAEAEASGGVVIKITKSEQYGNYASITFAEKPDWEIRKELKDAGFYWSGGSWNGKEANIPDCVAEMQEA